MNNIIIIYYYYIIIIIILNFCKWLYMDKSYADIYVHPKSLSAYKKKMGEPKGEPLVSSLLWEAYDECYVRLSERIYTCGSFAKYRQFNSQAFTIYKENIFNSFPILILRKRTSFVYCGPSAILTA